MTDKVAPTPLSEAQIFAQLKTHLQPLDVLIDVLGKEVTLFQRSMYKNQSQHRRAAFFQNLHQRCLRDIKLPSVKALFAGVSSVLAQLEVEPGMHHIAWKTLAADVKVSADAVLRQLVAFATDAAQVIVAAQKAYKYPFSQLLLYSELCICQTCLEAQFAMTYFMPFALMMNSVLSRLVVLFKTLLARAIESHGAITLLYLNEVTKSNPLRAKVTAVQLRGYQMPANVIQIANV
uniref:Nucleolus and neural progenitor protein-like N-terminal domain-containing protein n=1 Tax=Globisporangium ultimum (strain ATCC 200006 / CBS 805.95 / DAOM BR144) TaxID=431595 RepID=K3WPB0_GLOUD